jgi:polysaccharide biosynthesis/export protein
MPNLIFKTIRALRLAATVCLGTLFVSASVHAQAAETIGVGDGVRITIFQNPDLTTETRVSENGSIVFPMIGEVKVDGLTAAQAGSRIADRLKRGKYLVDPQVNVAMLTLRSRQASVLGQVARPGKYPLDEATPRLTDLIAAAGGIAPTGADVVTVLTNKDGKAVKRDIDMVALMKGGDPSLNPVIGNGDTVFVPRAAVFYIYGEVARSGAYRVEPNLSVRQAVSLGGGITPRGTERGMKIHRTQSGKTIQMDASPTDRVQADDIIYVKESLF